MFTGLVEDIGVVVDVRPAGNGASVFIRTKIPLAEVKLGDSIAVNGVCLTAESFGEGWFSAIAGAETRARSTLAHLRSGHRVHLERALAVGDRLGGHLVQGHVDGVGQVVSNTQERESWVLWLQVPAALLRYVAAKGSLCIDGVSLTVNEIVADKVRLNIVPHTVRVTRMGELRPGDHVNLEVDVLAKYVERLLGLDQQAGLSWDKLAALGFSSRRGGAGGTGS